MTLDVSPITFREAAEFVDINHRHHPAPAGHKFSIAVSQGNQVVGVIIVAERGARPGWDTPSRPRVDTTKHGIQRTLWEAQ